MNKPKSIFVLLLAIFTFTVITVFTAHSRGQVSQSSAPQQDSIAAKTPGRLALQEKLTKNSARPPLGQLQSPDESPENHLQRQLREALGRGRYRRGIMDPGVREVNGQTETVLLTFIDGVTILKPGERADPAGLPISSTAIVIGTVNGGKAFVSEDQTFVYSDYQVEIGEVIKPDPARLIPVGGRIVAWVSGGSILFPSGHLRHFVISGRGFPESGTQYVLFLRRTEPALHDYAIATAYALKNGIVLPLDDNEESKPFDGMKVGEFLNTLRTALKTVEEGGKR